MAAFDVLTPPNPDFRQLVKQIDTPCLLLFGDKGVVTATIAAELRSLNPGLQTAQIPDAGHSLHIDQPAQFAAEVQTFLASVKHEVNKYV
jgi:pimeloyl-ACP methyl ester carboxylesterase